MSEPEGAAVPGLRSRFVATREGGASKRPQASELEILWRAAQAGVVFWLEDDRLAYRAPRLAMTDELRDEIISHKAELIAVLRKNQLEVPLPAPAGVREGPLASGQERLWLIDRRIGPSPLYNIHFRLRWRGVLDRQALALAIGDTVDRHPALRTVFSESAGAVVAIVCEPGTPELVHHDLRGLDPASRASAAEEFIAGHQRAPFDLERGPLIRTAVLTLADDDHIVLVTQHHIITDGWSLRIFLADLGRCYLARYRGGPVLDPAPRFTFADFVGWELRRRDEEPYRKRLSWWKEHLAGLSPLNADRPVRLPERRGEDHNGPGYSAAGYSGAVLDFSVPAALATRLADLARAQGCTLYTLLLTAWSILLYRHTRQADFAIGTVTSGRDRVEFSDVLGFFANTLLFRCDLSGNPTVPEAIARIRAETESVFEHEVPFADIVMAAGAAAGGPGQSNAAAGGPGQSNTVPDTGLTPLIQAAFMFPNFAVPDFLGPEDATRIDASVTVDARIDGSVEGTTKFDLMLTMQESDGNLSGCLEYATARYSEAEAALMTEHFIVLLESIAQNPRLTISRLKIMSARERRQLLVEWNEKERSA